MNGLEPNQQKKTVRLFKVISINLNDIFRPRGWLSVKVVERKLYRLYSRGDSMDWDLIGRRPLPVRDHIYVVSIESIQ